LTKGRVVDFDTQGAVDVSLMSRDYKRKKATNGHESYGYGSM